MTSRKHYSTWVGIVERCCNPECKAFPNYGGRGIVLHSSFVRSYAAFEKHLDSLGEKGEGESLDRINVNLGYVPGNLRWASADMQANNKRNNSRVGLQREIRSRKARLRLSKRR